MERLADALAAVVLLVFGLAYSDFKSDNSAIISATVAVTVLIGLIIFGVAIVILWHERLLRNRFQWLSERLAILAQSVTALNRGLILQAITTTVVIWSLEAIVLKLVMSGFGIKCSGWRGSSLIFGTSAHSVRCSLPRPVTSVRCKRLLCFRFRHWDSIPTLGLLSATAVQLLLFGTVTTVGLLLLFGEHLHCAGSISHKKGPQG